MANERKNLTPKQKALIDQPMTEKQESFLIDLVKEFLGNRRNLYISQLYAGGEVVEQVPVLISKDYAFQVDVDPSINRFEAMNVINMLNKNRWHELRSKFSDVADRIKLESQDISFLDYVNNIRLVVNIPQGYGVNQSNERKPR